VQRTGGIARTYLHQGRKIGKAKSLGGVERLGIVRLSPDDEVLGGLHLCEGIESTLSGMSDPRMNFCPMWAAGSTTQLEKFPVLNGVECLTILADNDENEASVDAASAAYWRWKDAGREVHIRQPKEQGDLNDIIRRVR
jgi:putative DNA primase/helicase